MHDQKKWKNNEKVKSVSIKIEVEIENLEDLDDCLKTIKKQMKQGIPYMEGAIKKGLYYTASMEYKQTTDYREEEINGKQYRIINKQTSKWSV